ncbi:MAG TPA: phosphoglucosamine mutase, partial [Bacteroidales bacterium]|nr:phosphoglucosamine mutase [Bacteroidales bacterium]
GIRGTIGGAPGEGLTPLDIVKFTSAFASFIRKKSSKSSLSFVVGRDARISGEMVNRLVTGSLTGMGIDVIDVGLSTTPTVEIAVTELGASAGIILTASHNPAQWNALKLLNEKGEFIDDAEGQEVLALADSGNYQFAEVFEIGEVFYRNDMIDKHIEKVLELPLVDKKAIAEAGFKVAVDAVNSTGGIAIPKLLEKLGVVEIERLYCEPNGQFPHNPEPLPENLADLSAKITEGKSDVGFVVDPDVDRLAILCEDGSMFGEEYTLVAVADYVLANTPGNTVSNMSSTRALRDITEKHGGKYEASAVGEVNVVKKMKETNSVIGGEGNGGVIYPAIHYGRDALVGVALFLTHLAKSGKKVSEFRKELPGYVISKNKIALESGMDINAILKKMQENYSGYPINTEDGVKIEFEEEWVHLRKSNTEPIIRIYSESKTKERAEELAFKVMKEIGEIAGK